MCFSDPSQKEPPMAYKIKRGRDENDPSRYHLRTHSSVQRHMDHSPLPTDRSRHQNNKRYPKRYRNSREFFPKEGSYYEYPTMSWPYHQQNTKGKVFQTVHGERKRVEPLFTRTITDRNKHIKGVIYHPEGEPRKFKRAKDVYPGRGPC